MTGFDFIFMLTRNDRTVEDAADLLAEVRAAGVAHVGFKDVGLPLSDLGALARAIREGGGTSYLEVVSLDGESEVASALTAAEIGVDVLLGGTHVPQVLSVLKGAPVRYCPFPGRVEGHPSVLRGRLHEIVASASRLVENPGVHGLDLLAYRWDEDVPALMRAVCGAVHKPVIMAGSIDSPERIAAARRCGASGFTIGTAVLDRAFAPGEASLAGQLRAVRAAMERAALPG